MATPTPDPSAVVSETYQPLAPNDIWEWNVLCQTICLSIPGLMFILRTYVRVWIKRVWILEDYLCCFAFLGLAVYSSLLTTVFSKRGGTHEWYLQMSEVMPILYYLNITQIWYGPAAACTKSAILVLYIRVFSPSRRSKFYYTVLAMIVIICGFYFAITMAKSLQCLPRARIWDKTVPGNCVDLSVLLDASGLFNTLSDVCILLVPLKGVWNLQMSRKRKIGVYAIFTVGIVGPVFSIVGLTMRLKLATSMDQSYSQPLICIWATAELATGVMVICLPTLPGILHRHARRPSTTIVNGSGIKSLPRHGPKSLEKDDTLLEGNYFELRDGKYKEPQVHVPQTAFVNEIRGGGESADVDYQLGPRGDAIWPSDGIMKVTRIELS
ncbi:hypothetical protein MMC13_004334 [Lambiella insularis]|nr:hypothetical protein [Lambiella insularis]